MRSLLIYFALLLTQLMNAQIKQIGETDLSDYPSIKFKLHSRTFEKLNASDFTFSEMINGKENKINSSDLKLLYTPSENKEKNKCVLIMIEALSYPNRHEQVDAFFYGIKNSLKGFVNPGDKIKIVAFALRNKKTRILNNVNSSFTDNIPVLEKSIDDYKIVNNVFNNKDVSDLYGAVFEGIEMIGNESIDYKKSILLLSEERNNNFSTQKTSLNVINLAKEKNVVINTIKYNRANYEQYTDPTLAAQTFGESHVLKRSLGVLKNLKKQKDIEEIVPVILNNALSRANGSDYEVVLKLQNDKKDGGKNKIIVKQLNYDFETTLVFNSPGNIVFYQFQKNFYVSLLVSILILVLLTYGIFLLFKMNKKMRQKKELEAANQLQIQKDQEAAILSQQQELKAIKLSELQRLKEEQELKAEQIRINEEKEKVAQMRALGNFPILKFADSNNSAQFEINSSIVSVGRDKQSNVICIPNSNISRNHFSIVFENNEYRIQDNNSTNGIIVNGYKLKNALLNNGDIIEIADVTFTFYK